MIGGKYASGRLRRRRVMDHPKYFQSLKMTTYAQVKDFLLTLKIVDGSLLAGITSAMEHTLIMNLDVLSDLHSTRRTCDASGLGWCQLATMMEAILFPANFRHEKILQTTTTPGGTIPRFPRCRAYQISNRPEPQCQEEESHISPYPSSPTSPQGARW